MPRTIDLTPFGFTPTESTVYAALLDGGASSGYRVSKLLSLARANTYQALHGLVAKGAAVETDRGPPKLFRAISPRSLLALITRRQIEELDEFEQQVFEHPDEGAETIVPLVGRRAFEQVALRTTVRAPGQIIALAPQGLIEVLAPIWRKRAQDGTPTRLWALGELAGQPATPVEGWIPLPVVAERFGGAVAVLAAERTAVLAHIDNQDLMGHWTSDSLVVGSVWTALAHFETHLQAF